MKDQEIIDDIANLDVRNLNSLSSGLGCKYLKGIKGLEARAFCRSLET